jgi:dihydroorotase-like cyclic amidohydrolase
MVGAVALSVGAGLLAGQPAVAASTVDHGPASANWPAPTPRPAPSAEAKAIDEARAQARSSGKPVAIAHLTTGTSQTVANPDGTLTSESTPVPERVKGTDGN